MAHAPGLLIGTGSHRKEAQCALIAVPCETRAQCDNQSETDRLLLEQADDPSSEILCTPARLLCSLIFLSKPANQRRLFEFRARLHGALPAKQKQAMNKDFLGGWCSPSGKKYSLNKGLVAWIVGPTKSEVTGVNPARVYSVSLGSADSVYLRCVHTAKALFRANLELGRSCSLGHTNARAQQNPYWVLT